jgi:hypothetical protein
MPAAASFGAATVIRGRYLKRLQITFRVSVSFGGFDVNRLVRQPSLSVMMVKALSLSEDD